MPEVSGDVLPPPDDCIANIAQEQGLELADVVPDGYHPGFGVELLVGADHYWDITTGSVKRINERLVAVETVFGWSLHGTDATSSAQETAEHAPAKYFCQTKESFDDQYKPCTPLSSTTNQPTEDKDNQE
ncbi:hypothetical protein MTO96_046186 [Rhipicephalus appendiculatus]